MRLAMLDPAGTGRCLLCKWDWKCPSHKRGKVKGTLVLLSKEEKTALLEERILAHLRDSHDRVMLIKEEPEMREKLEGMLQKAYYNGRNPFAR